jgi:hypothetical protein
MDGLTTNMNNIKPNGIPKAFMKLLAARLPSSAGALQRSNITKESKKMKANSIKVRLSRKLFLGIRYRTVINGRLLLMPWSSPC